MHIYILHHLLCPHNILLLYKGGHQHLRFTKCLVNKFCSTTVNRRLLNYTSWSCGLHWKLEASACSTGLFRTLNPWQVSVVLQAQLCEWSDLYLCLHAKRCKRLAGSVGHRQPRIQETKNLKQWYRAFKNPPSLNLAVFLPEGSAHLFFSFETSGGFLTGEEKVNIFLFFSMFPMFNFPHCLSFP